MRKKEFVCKACGKTFLVQWDIYQKMYNCADKCLSCRHIHDIGDIVPENYGRIPEDDIL